MSFLFAGLHSRVVCAGGAISGVVVVVTEDEDPSALAHLYELRVTVRGEETVLWQTLLGKNLLSDEVSQESIVRFEQTTVLWSRSGDNDTRRTTDEGKAITQIGTHTFRFTFDLPANLPGSFDEKSLSSTSITGDWIVPAKSSWHMPVRILPDSGIRYIAQVYLVRDDQPEVQLLRRTLPFVVRENFKQYKLTNGPQSKTASKTFFLAGNLPLHLKATLLERVGFTNDELHFIVEIRNFSSKNVDGLSLILRQTVTFLEGEKALQREHIIDTRRVSNTSVPANENNNFSFHIRFDESTASTSETKSPATAALVPSVLLGKLISVKYKIEVEARVPRAINLSVAFPFQFIGRTTNERTLASCVLPDNELDANEKPDEENFAQTDNKLPPAMPPRPRPSTIKLASNVASDRVVSLNSLREQPLLGEASDGSEVAQLVAPSTPTPPITPDITPQNRLTDSRSPLSNVIQAETNEGDQANHFSLDADDDAEEEVITMSAI